MSAETLSLPSVNIVDANRDEYHALAIALRLEEAGIRLFTNGTEALQAIGAFTSSPWIVNLRLPDMSGVDFLELIRHRLRRCRVILVGNDYSAEDERAARSAGATAYVCKPASATWLAACRTSRRSPDIRAGPEPFV